MESYIRPRRDGAALRLRRMRAARWFFRRKSPAWVAHRLKVSRQSACRWYAAWEAQGKRGLIGAARLGRPAKLTERQLRRLDTELMRGARAHGYVTQLWTLKRIAKVVKKLFGVSYHPSHVWRLLRELGWSCQRPARRARERDEAAIRHWLRYRWPQIKKSAAAAETAGFSG